MGRKRRQFQGIKKLRRGFQPLLTMIKSSSGELLISEMKVIERWKEYFQKILKKLPPDELVNVRPGCQMGQTIRNPPKRKCLMYCGG